MVQLCAPRNAETFFHAWGFVVLICPMLGCIHSSFVTRKIDKRNGDTTPEKVLQQSK
ncbi:hypothetical protein Cflav_PD5505 [Pedosphaera parvula Ellin514]|uniref:Uncharacterized protein n=1 Tax=Pedosphaera parvula (strain Ellin514) TaxID=320771 RepID=B9XBI5_PEDPL|nr:hypothetical protein Cflav_PD5505 [Pedosphaera parvula Ellin514]